MLDGQRSGSLALPNRGNCMQTLMMVVKLKYIFSQTFYAFMTWFHNKSWCFYLGFFCCFWCEALWRAGPVKNIKPFGMFVYIKVKTENWIMVDILQKYMRAWENVWRITIIEIELLTVIVMTVSGWRGRKRFDL